MYLHDDLRYYSCQHIMYVFHTSSQNKRGNSHSFPSTIVPHVLTNAKQTWVIYRFYGGGVWAQNDCFTIEAKIRQNVEKTEKNTYLFILTFYKFMH